MLLSSVSVLYKQTFCDLTKQNNHDQQKSLFYDRKTTQLAAALK